MTNKKTQFFSPGLILVALAIIASTIVALHGKEVKFEDAPLGKRQFDLIDIYYRGEASKFYVDKSAEHSVSKSIILFSKNGGFFEDSECGKHSGANIWTTIEYDNGNLNIIDCAPTNESSRQNFQKYLDNILGIYLASYPDIFIPSNYDYEFKDNLKIIGKSNDDIIFEIRTKEFIPEILPESSNSEEAYSMAVNGKIPQILRVPMKSNPDVETIKIYHPDVWNQYVELCKKMDAVSFLGAPPGPCSATPEKCCITSGYRHPAYNAEIGGARNSPHQYGNAIDIYVGKGLNEQLSWAREASKLFTRVGVYPGSTHIHVDLMPQTAQFEAKHWIGDGGKTVVTASNLDELEREARNLRIT